MFSVHNHTSGTAEARVAKLCVQVEYSKSFGMTNHTP